MRLKDPGECKRADVSGIDLIERAEATTRIVPVIGRPGIGCRSEQSRRVEPLRRGERYMQAQCEQQEDDHHHSAVQMKARIVLKGILATAPDLDYSTPLRKHTHSCLLTLGFSIPYFRLSRYAKRL